MASSVLTNQYNTNYIGNIKQNLNIFRGTYLDCKKLEAAGKVVNYGLYFATDIHTFYVGNAIHKLEAYGSANIITTDSVKQIAKELIGNELNIFFEQIKAYDSRIVSLENDKTAVLSNSDKLALMNEIQNNIQSTLNDTVKNSIDSIRDTIMSVETGDKILQSLDPKNTEIRYYYASDNSTDSANTILKGNVYMISGIRIDNLTTNSYLANNYVDPTISITIDDFPSTAIIGQDVIANNKTINISINNIFYLNDKLTLLVDDEEITTFDKSESSINVSFTLKADKVATKKIIVKGTSLRNKEITGTYSVNVLAPIYYGADDAKFTTEYTDYEFNKLKQKLSMEISGEYEITCNKGQYLWFYVPEGLTNITNKVYCNGFAVPFALSKDVTKKTNGLYITYKCYRSVYSLESGNYTITVKE